MSEEVVKKGSKGKRFLLGLLYWALLILDCVVAFLAESPIVGIILSAILAVVFIIWPKRKSFCFYWWIFLAIALCAFYIFWMTKSA